MEREGRERRPSVAQLDGGDIHPLADDTIIASRTRMGESLMSKLLLVFALTFTPTVLLSASAQAANVPTPSNIFSGSPPIRQVARRYTSRRGTSSSRTPNYLLLKSDPRRYNGPNYFVHPPFLSK